MIQTISNLTSETVNLTSIDPGLMIPTFAALVLLAAMVILYLASSLARFRTIYRAYKVIADIITTAAIGAITLGGLYLAYLVYSIPASAASRIDPAIYLLAAGGFTASVIVGLFVKWIAHRIKHHLEILKAEKAAGL